MENDKVVLDNSDGLAVEPASLQQVEPKKRGRKPKAAPIVESELNPSDEDTLSSSSELNSDLTECMDSNLNVDEADTHIASDEASNNNTEPESADISSLDSETSEINNLVPAYIRISHPVKIYRAPNVSGYSGRVKGQVRILEVLSRFVRVKVRVPEAGLVTGYLRYEDIEQFLDNVK